MREVRTEKRHDRSGRPECLQGNDSMYIAETTSGAWSVIELRGKFVIKHLALIRRYFDLAEKRTAPSIAIDMSGVSQLDSSAITILVNFQRRIIQKDGLLVLFGMRRDIAEIFSIVGIDKLFRICATREEFEKLYGAIR